MRRLKISEQLIIVTCIAVFLPFFVSGLVITNLTQHAVRNELNSSALITADNVYQRIINAITAQKSFLSDISSSLKYIPDSRKSAFIQDIAKSSSDFESFDMVSDAQLLKMFNNLTPVYGTPDIIYSAKHKKLYSVLRDHGYSIVAVINLKKFRDGIFKYLVQEKRQVYVFDNSKELLMSYNFEPEKYSEVKDEIPTIIRGDEPVHISKRKNQPSILIKVPEVHWQIVVATPKNLTTYGIVTARTRIVLAMVITALIVVFSCLAYSISLNTSIKQLLKAISAISRGNYKRRVRLIKDQYTPYELVFLSDEFNNMAERVENSYQALQKANEQLAILDEVKSNLIDTVSHEFRTPLTCIRGYASSLLRPGIKMEQDMLHSSMKVVKQQAERLSRLVEDLLVIPDIESSKLAFYPDEIDLIELTERCISTIRQKHSMTFNFKYHNESFIIYSDPDRLEQVIINLLDNAAKYSLPSQDIDIEIYEEENFNILKIKNSCEHIPSEKLITLFDKFTRVDDSLTRTTRGTGLGLFISKGIIDAMKGRIEISSDDGFTVFVKIPQFLDI